MTAVWENNVYGVGIAKCCKENEINVYRKEIKNVYYVEGMYARWSLICLLKGDGSCKKQGEWLPHG
jgi:hypothetical protein